ncbi:hypothetical protein [Nocardiopsis chromatogenes]|uniref:hypothetical protein n=1 Tax=Nocardiopsis chromatogenes TaxID=280239 RepID=UPI000349E7B7|nr:hypothetical protein [Nocardiopsis chromatogenes]
MPSLEHEFPLDIIRHNPEAAVELLESAQRVPVPKFGRVRCESGDATTTAAVEYRIDSAVVCEDDDVPKMAIIIENQLKKDENKEYSWPVYVANLRARLRCPVRLVVLVPKEGVSQWSGTPIDLGCGEIRPLPLLMGTLPPVTDPEKARAHPELAIIAAAHNTKSPRSEEGQAALHALLAAFEAIDQSMTSLYSDYVLAALPREAREYLEEIMGTGTYEYQTKLFRRSFADGKANGLAEAVVTVLESRGIDIPSSARERIASCTDRDTLTSWLQHAAVADSVEVMFGDS